MIKSESIKELSAALVKAQTALEGVTKDKNNPFFKSKYADLSSVVGALKEPLTKNGLAYTQVMHDADSAAKVETIILHSSGEWLSCGVISVPVSKHDAQGYGSALTYARRYSLSAAFGVAPEDDDGNAAAKSAPNKVVDAILKANIKPMAGAGDDLTQEEAQKVSDVASRVLDWINSGSIADAVTEKENAALNTEETLYFWTFFDSKQKTAMKNEFSKQRTERLNKETATQA
jgi:hypothetical protein